MKKIVLAISLFILVEGGLHAKTYTFTGASNTLWSFASNWSGGIIAPSVLPLGDSIILSAGCDVNIPSLTINGYVSYTNMPFFKLSTGMSVLVGSTGYVTLYDILTNTGNFQINGSFIVDDQFINRGNLTINSSTVKMASLSNAGGGSILINSGGMLNAYGIFLGIQSGSMITIDGTLVADSNVTTTNSGQLTINAGGQYLHKSTKLFDNASGGKVTNKGIMEIDVSSNNSGIITNTSNSRFVLNKSNFRNVGSFIVDTFAELALDVTSVFNILGSFDNKGIISGEGRLDNSGPYTGATGSIISPASAGAGTLFLNPATPASRVFDFTNSTYQCDIGGISAGSTHDQVSAKSGVQLTNASLNVHWSSFMPVAGQSFTIMTFTNCTGQFASVNIPSVAGLIFNVQYNSTSVVILAISSSLPLHVLSFDGEVKQGKAVLTWKTENEENTDHFDIEKSSDGVSFKTTGSVSSFNEAGQHQYNFTDMQNLQSNTYYRLRQVDKDAQFSYSHVLRLAGAESGLKVRLFPNPATGKIMIESAAKDLLNTKAVLLNQNGNIVQSFLITQQVQPINIGHLPAGVYILRIQNGISRMIIKK